MPGSPSGGDGGDRLKVGSLKVRHLSKAGGGGGGSSAVNGSGGPSFDHAFQPVDVSAATAHLPDFDEKLVNHPEVMGAGDADSSCYYSEARQGFFLCTFYGVLYYYIRQLLHTPRQCHRKVFLDFCSNLLWGGSVDTKFAQIVFRVIQIIY